MAALFVAVTSFVLGYAAGKNGPRASTTLRPQPGADGLLPPQAFIPESMRTLQDFIQHSTDNLP